MCCVFCCMPAFCFQVRFRMSRCTSVGAHSTAAVCAMCVYSVFFALSHVGCCVAVGVRGCSTWLHYALRECFPCEWFIFFFQHLGQSRVAVCFSCVSTVTARWRTNHFAGHSGASTVRLGELNSRLCVAVMLTGACYSFEIVRVVLQVGVSIIFHFVRTACGALLWLGPWSRMTRNSSVDDCASTDDSPTLARTVGFRCIFRSSTHVRNDRTAAAIAHLKVLHACDIVAPFRRQCRVTAAMSAPQRGLRGAVCCLNMFSVSYVCNS